MRLDEDFTLEFSRLETSGVDEIPFINHRGPEGWVVEGSDC